MDEVKEYVFIDGKWIQSGSEYARGVAEGIKELRGSMLILAERFRQVASEGYTAEHDKNHDHELMQAAQAYLLEAMYPGQGLGIRSWPWDSSYWKPDKNPIRNLTKAGALIAAAIDTKQRAYEEVLDDL